MDNTDPLSRSRCRERRLNNFIIMDKGDNFQSVTDSNHWEQKKFNLKVIRHHQQEDRGAKIEMRRL